MTTTTPAITPEALAVQQLCAKVASNADFQRETAAYSTEEALELVFDGGEVVDGSSPRCSAIVYEINGEPPLVLPDGSAFPAGQLILDLWLCVENGDDMRGELLRINNFAGSISTSINQDDGTQPEGGYVLRATKSGAPQRSHPAHVAEAKPDSEWWFVQYMVSWDAFGK